MEPTIDVFPVSRADPDMFMTQQIQQLAIFYASVCFAFKTQIL
jgi:hypothetical protein